MCGIAGMVNWGGQDLLLRMNEVQTHRGPDDSGIWESALPGGDQVGLASRRLSILDLSPAGHMPMSTPDGRLTIVYNGEIYNYPELKRQLKDCGYNFRSSSDTEAILYLYQEYGPQSVTRLNGMFALAIWDQARQELFLARDHFGIKPLYYTRQAGRLAFASEVKALLELPGVTRRPNLQALNQYLSFLWVPDPLTMFENIYKLPAGHYALYRQGQLELKQYWDLDYPPAGYDLKEKESDLIAELRSRFLATVKSQMLSDVPLGSFLSAGLDSNSIVAAMARFSKEPVRTYTIAFPPKYRRGETTLDDTEVAKRSAKYFGCIHTEIVVEPDVVDLLPKLVWHMDEPVADPAIIPAYLVNRKARQTVTVLLSGVGGDEIFAGYRKHVAHDLAKRYQSIPAPLRQKLIEPFVLNLPAMTGTAFGGHVRLAKKMVRSGSLPPEERFLMDCTYLSEAQKENFFLPALNQKLESREAGLRHRDYFDRAKEADFLNQMLYLDTKTFMVSLNLTYNDKMSMASSVEVRVPFLDWELVEWVAWHVPPRLKLNGNITKYILREAMKPLVPPEVLQQKKAGFGAPAAYWLSHDLQEMVGDLLSESRIKQRGYFEPKAVHSLIQEHQSGRRDWSLPIWAFLTFELWQQSFMDKVCYETASSIS